MRMQSCGCTPSTLAAAPRWPMHLLLERSTWRASELVYHPHRRTGARIVVIAAREVAAPHVVDEVIGNAMRGRHLDHVQLPVHAVLFDGFSAAPLNRHLRLERGVELETGRR